MTRGIGVGRAPALLVLLMGAAWMATLGHVPAFAQDDSAMTVEEFVKRKEQWPRLQQGGTTLTIEGRRQVLNDERLFFTNCDLIFQLGEGVRPPMSKTKSIQVSGTLEMRQGKQVFLISRIKSIPTDEERLADKRGRLPIDDAAPWYPLADWASARGAFYNDDTLKAEAADLRRHGILIEYRQVGPNDIAPLYALAKKVEEKGLPFTLRDEIKHDAVRRELRAAQKKDATQREIVLTHILQDLPGAGIAVEFDDATRALQQEYEQDPLKVYEQADANARQKLHRLLYASAKLESIKRDADPEGENGYEIAARIEANVPEYKDQADEYRTKELTLKLGQVAKLSRENLLELVERVKVRPEYGPPRATEVLREWITAREPEFRSREVSGLMDLAQEHIDLLNDADGAAEIYKEVFKERTGQELARKHLVELGYEFDGTSWEKPAGGAASTVTAAIRQGVIRPGMTSEQVQAAFGGRPTSIVKLAVRGLVSELWVYAEQGVAIEFRRRGPEADAIASEISDLTGP